MLGFIMSKMQMLLFAVGIAVVALLFYNFVSTMGLQNEGYSLVNTNAKLISDQMNNDLLCSFKTTTLPDRLEYGMNSTPFFYDLEFSKANFGEGENTQNLLVLRVVEQTSNKNAKKNVIAAKSVAMNATIVLIDPAFIGETSPLGPTTYNQESISLNPRAASITQSSPNALVALKEVKGGQNTMYIIPCSTEHEKNNCLRNILRVGCYKLKLLGGAVTDSTPIESCFNITTQAQTSIEKSQNYNWGDCKTLFPEITSN